MNTPDPRLNKYSVGIPFRDFWAEDAEHAIEQFLDMLGCLITESDMERLDETLDAAGYAVYDVMNDIVAHLDVREA